MKGSGGRTVGQNASGSDLLNLAINSPLPASKKIRTAPGAGTLTCDADDACRRGNCIRLRACGIEGRMKKNCVPWLAQQSAWDLAPIHSRDMRRHQIKMMPKSRWSHTVRFCGIPEGISVRFGVVLPRARCYSQDSGGSAATRIPGPSNRSGAIHFRSAWIL